MRKGSNKPVKSYGTKLREFTNSKLKDVAEIVFDKYIAQLNKPEKRWLSNMIEKGNEIIVYTLQIVLAKNHSFLLNFKVYGGRGCNQFELFQKYPLILKYYLQDRFLYIKKYL